MLSLSRCTSSYVSGSTFNPPSLTVASFWLEVLRCNLSFEFAALFEPIRLVSADHFSARFGSCYTAAACFLLKNYVFPLLQPLLQEKNNKLLF